MRYPAKWLAWSSFGLAAMAGLGFDALRFSPGGTRGRALFGAAAVAALAAAAFSPLSTPVRLCCCIGAAALGFLALGLGRRPLAGGLLGAAAAAGLVGALALALRPLPRFAPEAQLTTCPESVTPLARVAGRVVTPPMGALWGWVAARRKLRRRDCSRASASPCSATRTCQCRVPTVRTAAPLPTAAAAAIAGAIGPAEDALPAGAAGARVLWTPFAPARLPSEKDRRLLSRAAGALPAAARRSCVATASSPNAERAWARVAAGEIDLTREVLLDRRPVPDPAGADEHPMLLARLVEDAPERVVAELTASYPGLLVLADLDYPGWVAEEGGRALPILKADGFFRAVALPAGAHRVVFRYRPMAFYGGAGVSALALLVTLALWHAGEPVRTRRPA